MMSLPQVLHEAVQHEASEVVIEAGQPVTIQTTTGAVVLGKVVAEAELSDALSQVLAPEQQAELAVTSVVAFKLDDARGRWSLVAQTEQEGVVVRAQWRASSQGEEIGTPLELPPLEPFEPDQAPSAPRAPQVVLPRPTSRSTQWDVGLVKRTPDASSSMPDALEREPTMRVQRIEPSVTTESRGRGSGGEPVDFKLVVSSGSVPNPSKRMTTAPVIRSPDASRTAELGVDGRSSLVRADAVPFEPVEFLSVIPEGSVVFVQGFGQAARLAEACQQAHEVIDLETWDLVTTRPVAELSPDGLYVVELEDPSRCLGWLLRRLEEGARFIVETGARTPAGARRVLQGIEASLHTERWLDAHHLFWSQESETGWMIEPM